MGYKENIRMSLFKKQSSEIKKFEERFDKEIKEMIVVTEGEMSAGRSGQDEYWTASITILAYIDVRSGELFEGKRRIEWLVNDKECRSSKKIYNLKGQKIYQLIVRESLPYENEYTHDTFEKGHWLMLVDVKKRNYHNAQLEDILKEYQKEVSIHPQGCQKLILDKSLGIFSGEGNWNHEECYIHLDTDGEGIETADEALKTFQELMANGEVWDQKAREYAADELTELANEWAEENDLEITHEDFAKRMVISEVCVSLEGDFELFYNDDDMFYGHVIIVSGNIHEGFKDAYIAG